MPESQSRLVWALLSAVFAGATAILAKIGLLRPGHGGELGLLLPGAQAG